MPHLWSAVQTQCLSMLFVVLAYKAVTELVCTRNPCLGQAAVRQRSAGETVGDLVSTPVRGRPVAKVDGVRVCAQETVTPSSVPIANPRAQGDVEAVLSPGQGLPGVTLHQWRSVVFD